MEQLEAYAREYGQMLLDVFSRPAVLIQLGLIAVLFVPALLLSRKVEPALEARARGIQGMPGLLRVIVGFLRRLEWLFFALFLGIAYVATRVVSWPDSNYLIYSAALLTVAWLVISVVSHVIRSRALRKLFAAVAWTYVAATILGVVDDVAAVLDGAGFTVGEVRISVLRALQAVLFIGGLIWISVAAGNFVDRRIQGVEELTPSLRVLLGKILRIALIVFAVLIAMQGLGIDLTALTVLSGAVGVGIGFGLQKVVSNFISGIILLMDQSIKPGDTITLGTTFGWIRELRARFVSVVTRDGREYLIPNEDFITREVINWSFTDRFVRVDVPFGVSYESDPHEVTRLAVEAAASCDRVDAEAKSPVCWITGFGDSSIDFVLRFWIDDPQQGITNVRGVVLMALWDAFQEHGIGLPVPPRVIIMRSPVTVAGAMAGAGPGAEGTPGVRG